MTGGTWLERAWREVQAQWQRFNTDPRVPDVLVGMVGGIGLVLLWAALRSIWAAQWGHTLLALLLGIGCLCLVWLHLALTGADHSPDPSKQQKDRP